MQPSFTVLNPCTRFVTIDHVILMYMSTLPQPIQIPICWNSCFKFVKLCIGPCNAVNTDCILKWSARGIQLCVLFTIARTHWPHSEQKKFNDARSETTTSFSILKLLFYKFLWELNLFVTYAVLTIKIQCRCTLSKRILIISFVWDNNMAAMSIVFCVSWDWVKTKNMLIKYL